MQLIKHGADLGAEVKHFKTPQGYAAQRVVLDRNVISAIDWSVFDIPRITA